MRFDFLSDLPEWEDDEFRNEDEQGEEWKTSATTHACKELYFQWNSVMMMLNGLFDTMKLPEEESEDSLPKDYWEDHKAMLTGDAYQVAVKIKSSEVGLYTIRMENAAIIRKNAQFIYSALLTMMIEKVVEEQYVRAIRSEIDKFRELFKNWVATFRKDEYVDEWGLFI